MASSAVIRVPEREGDFERHCRVLFADLANDPNLKLVATRGKNQGGFDLIGKRDGDPDRPIGVQCKNKPKGGRLDLKDVRSDISRMLEFEPPVTELYVVTTASDDLSYDKLALDLCKEQKALNRSVDIQIWGWDSLADRILTSAAALAAFDPDYSASTTVLLERTATTVDLQQEGMRLQVENQTVLAEIRAGIGQLLQPVDATPSAIDALLDRQIDSIRDLLNSGRPRSALELLGKLEASADTYSAAVRSRIVANKGHALLRLGEEEQAGNLLLEAYAINPEDPKLKANQVLGLMLLGQFSEAVEVANAFLLADSTNVGVASFLYQAVAFLDTDPSPDDTVDEALRSDENVAIGRAVYLRQHRGLDQWRDWARHAAQDHPNSAILRRLAAEATLEGIFEERAYGPGDVNSESREALITATATLRELWDEARTQEDATEQQVIGIAANLVTAYRALSDPQSADTVGQQALALAPADEALLLATAHIDTILGRQESAIAKLVRLPESRQRTIPLIGAYAALGRWTEVLPLVTPERRQVLDGLDLQAFDCLAVQARLENGVAIDKAGALEALVAAWPQELHVVATAADLARRYHAEKFDELFETAMALSRGQVPLVERLVLADLALQSERFEAVVDVLIGHINTRHESEPLAMLALAFANSDRSTEAHSFFAALPHEILSNPRYARLAGAVEYNRGDLSSAEIHLKQVLSVDPSDLRTLLMLEGTYLREGRQNEAWELIRECDENLSRGAAFLKMRLAVSLRWAGETERALTLGFQVASTNRDNEQAAAGFPQMLFMSDEALPQVNAQAGIQDGFWFRLEGQGMSDIEGLLSDTAIPEVHCHSPESALGAAVLGKRVGDEVTLPATLGIERKHVVREIKHKWIWLAHDIMHSHAARFPDCASIVEMTVRDHDVQPVLDIVRKTEDEVISVVEQYQASPLPLGFIAALHHGDVMGFAHRVAASGGAIKTCVGLLHERKQAQRVVRRGRGNGAVLDTYTLVVAEGLDLLPLLREYFKRLVISRATMDEFAEWRQRQALNVGRETMTLAYDGEQAIRHVQSGEDNARQLARLDTLISNVRANCEVLPLEGRSDADAMTFEHAGLDDLLEPIRMARTHQLVLLSEDLHYRQLAQQLGIRQTSWLQAFGLDLRDQRLMSNRNYALLTARLAYRRHGFLTTDAETFLELLGLEGDDRDNAFDALARNIGGEKADLASHAKVVISFACQVWSLSVPSWRKGRAIGRLLSYLLQGQNENAITLLNAVQRGLRVLRPTLNFRSDLAIEYVLGWRMGHFFDRKSAPSRISPSNSHS